MSTDVLYKESMYWISQFQTFRNEILDIKKTLSHSELSDKDQPTQELLQRMIVFIEHLDDTEESILAGINNGTTYWPGRDHTYDFSKKPKSTDELFDRVKMNYNNFIELQRSASAIKVQSS